MSYKKNEYQSTSIKVQVSISHTPEGTNTASTPLKVGVRKASMKDHEASANSTDLCTTPVDIAGVTIPKGPTAVSWVLELWSCWYKPSGAS